MDAIVVGDDDPPPAHPGKSPIECRVIDIDCSPKRRDERGKQLVDGITGHAWLDSRPAAKHPGVHLLEGAKGHHRAVQPDEQFDGDLVTPCRFRISSKW